MPNRYDALIELLIRNAIRLNPYVAACFLEARVRASGVFVYTLVHIITDPSGLTGIHDEHCDVNTCVARASAHTNHFYV